MPDVGEVSGSVSDRVKHQIKYCLDMEADVGKHEVHDDLRLKLGKLLSKSNVPKQLNLRSSSNSNYEKKMLDNAFQELSSDIMKLNKHFECLIECFYTILDKIDEIKDLKNKLKLMELRVTKLEKGPSNTKHVDCRQGDHSPNEQANRIDRLEYISSELNVKTAYCRLSYLIPVLTLTATC